MPPGTDGYPGVPRWVKITGLVLLALVLLFLAAKAFGFGGEHGPGRHTGASEAPAGQDGGHDAKRAEHGGNSRGAATRGPREAGTEGAFVVGSAQGWSGTP